MADEVLEQAVEDTEGEQSTGSNQNNKQETFSQEQVNKILAKEKASWKRSTDRDREGWTESEKSLRESIKERDAVISEAVALLKKDLNLDEDLQELFDGMDILAQYKWLTKKVEKDAKKDIPRTPQSQGKVIQSQPFRRTQSI